MRTLEDLVVGDCVVVQERYNAQSIVTIARLTKTQIITTKDVRYSRKNGDLVGRDVWSTNILRPEIDVEAVRSKNAKFRAIHNMRQWLSNTSNIRFNVDKLTVAEIEQMFRTMQEWYDVE